MPEASEVKVISDGLNRFLQGATITSIYIYPKSRFIEKPIQDVKYPLSVLEVTAKGKLIYFRLVDRENKELYAFSTLGMTGFWITDEQKHTSFALNYIKDGKESKIYFNDVRHFGTFDYEYDLNEAQRRLGSLAGDFLSRNPITPEQFAINLRKQKSKSLVKQLMDQHAICSGIGNYLLSETLYACQLSPETKCDEADPAVLYREARRIIFESYSHFGMSMSDYVDIDGNKGMYYSHLKVYGREYTPKGEKVLRKIGSHGRTIHYVDFPPISIPTPKRIIFKIGIPLKNSIANNSIER